jgi:chaperonin cofactor prefoldin
VTNDEISLREYFEARWKAHEHEHEMLAGGIETGQKDIDRRLEEMNQFRAQIQQERGEFLTKMEYESRHRELEVRLSTNKDAQDKRLNILELAKSNMDGRLWALGAIVTVLTVLVNIAFRYWTK